MSFFRILFDFYLFFRIIFYQQNREKGVLLLVGADVATRRLTWRKGQSDVASGTNSGCDVALRPRGSALVARAGGARGAAK